jgi:hypothetical protein
LVLGLFNAACENFEVLPDGLVENTDKNKKPQAAFSILHKAKESILCL